MFRKNCSGMKLVGTDLYIHTLLHTFAPYDIRAA